MNFNGQGWFNRYLEFRRNVPLPHVLPSAGVKVLEDTGMHHELDQAIYYFLQPTGLLYGFPVGLPFDSDSYPSPEFLNTVDRTRLIFLDSLFACMVADRHYLLEGFTEEEDHLPPVTELAAQYFLSGPFALRHRYWWRFRPFPLFRKGNRARQIERVIQDCIGQGADLLRMPGYFYNSFLFLDLYFCMLWQRRMLVDPDSKDNHLRELGQQQMELRALMLRMIVGTATASGRVDATEQRVIEWFFRSSGLPRPVLSDLRQELRLGISWDTVQVPDMPWLVRRFVLEMMLMILLVERSLDEEGLRFMEQAVDKLGLWNEELNQSVIALEMFILHRGDQLQVLSNRSAWVNIGDTLRERATVAVRKNLQRVLTEIRETQELYNLLLKATSTPLTAEEKHKVQQQLLDIIKTIPALAIFALPGGGLILPVLIRLLPFNLLPSAFEE